MKKLITWILLLAMCLSLFAGCKSTPSNEITGNEATGNETPDTTTTVDVEDPVDEVDPADLAAAIEYVKTIYKKAAEITAKDFQRIGTVPMGDLKFEVVWTVDVSEDLVKIVKEANGMVTIDVNEECEKETPYVLTATITDAAGNSASHSWNHKLPGALDMDLAEIVNAAYALANGESLPYEATLTGMITSIDTPWSADYKNITVTISIEGCPGKPIMCYRLKGDGADKLAVGDTITVTGTLKNYNGTIEFDAGCTLDELVKGDGVTPEAPSDPLQIIDEAYALANGEALLYNATLTGVITSVDTPWSDQYGNITVTIVVSGRESKPIQCYRLKGDGAANLVKGDTVTVTGQLKNYNGTIEFNAGCTLDKVEKTGGPAPELPSDRTPQSIVDALYNLGANESLPSCSLTGVITKIDTPWSDQYNNISVTIVIENRESKPVLCYRLKGEGASGLAVGDTITVTGILTNYVGSMGIPTYEFTAGCVVSNIVKGEGGTVTPEEPDKPVVDIPSSLRGSISNGDKVVIYAPAYGKALSAEKVNADSFYNRGVDVSVDGDKLVGFGESEIWTVIKNEDGSYSFANGGQKIGLGEQFSSMNLGAVYADWKVSSLGDGLYLIQNVGRENYIEWYSSKDNWSTYNSSSAATDDQFQMAFYLVEDDTTEEPDIPTEPETPEEPEEPEEPEVPDEPVTPTTPEEIVDAAYALESGASLEGTYTLTGVITSVDTAYSEQYKNVTVTIQVGNMTDKPIMCYRLKGEGADVIAVGDMITVTGKLKNYNGTVEFDAGCTLDSYMTPAQIVDAAYALENGASLEGTYTLTGVITSVDTPYSEQYKNITVTIQVGDLSNKLIMCYRLTGDGADALAVGDTITVTGKLKNYNGTVEFDAKCSLDNVIKGGVVAPEAPEDPAEIVKEAYELEAGAALPYEATLTGVITSVDSEYSESFKNITVTIQVGDLEDMPIMCYRLKGEGADVIAVGDTITVTGSIKNYNGTVEFVSGCTLDSYEKASDEEDPTVPSEPEEPTVPSEPEDPTDPSEPEDTTVPSEPEDTTVPSEPEDTTVPSEPEDTTVPSEPEDTTVPSEPEEPETPKAYKYYLEQVNLGKTLYFSGAVNGSGFLLTTEDITAAVNVYLEEAETGVRMYFLNGDVKTYIEIAKNASGKVRHQLVTEPTMVYTYDEEAKTYAADVEGTAYYTGAYNNFDTFSASKTSYITGDNAANVGVSQFVAAFVESGSEDTPVEPEDPTTPSEPEEPETPKAYKYYLDQVNLGKTLYFSGAVNGSGFLLTTEDITAAVDVYLEEAETGVRMYFLNGDVKTYIEIAKNASGKVRHQLVTEPTMVYTYDEEAKTYVADVEGTAYYTGAYNNFDTFSASKTSYITGDNAANVGVSQFVATFVESGSEDTPVEPEDPTTPSEPTDPSDPTDPTEPDEPAGLPIGDGDQVVIYAPAYGKALSTIKTGFYNVGVDVVINDGILTGYAETEIWTVVDNRDGTFSFANGEQNIGLAESYSSLDLGAVNDDWNIVDLGDGLYLIQNVVRGNYIEWYASKNNWSSYNSSSAATDDQFQLSFYVIN